MVVKTLFPITMKTLMSLLDQFYIFSLVLKSFNNITATFSRFSWTSSIQDGEAYAYLLKALAPEHANTDILDAKDPNERAKKILEQAEKLDCKRYLSEKDIVEGSPNLNLAFVAQIFQHRWGFAALFHVTYVFQSFCFFE